jgi:hypothetical protein
MNEIINLRQNCKLFTLLSFVFLVAIWQVGIVTFSKLAFISLAFLFLFSAILKSNTIALVLIFTMAFSQGILLLLMGIPTIVPRMVMELSIVFLFAKSLYLQSIVYYRRPIKAFGFLPMLGLFTVSLLSFYVNEQPTIAFLLFCRHIFIFYLLFVTLLNLNLSEKTIRKINKYLIFLFLIQIPAAIIKFIFIGLEEGRGIGTVSVQGGGLSTTLPLFAIAFLLSLYIFKRNNIYILLIAGFIAFGLLGEKRALAFYIPILMIFLYYMHTKGGFYKKALIFNWARIKIFAVIILISLAGLYAVFKTQFLVGSALVGGASEIRKSFDIRYMVNVAIEYETHVTAPEYSFGRLASTVRSYNVLKNDGPLTLLFGHGAGYLIESSLIDEEERERNAYLRLGIIAGKTGLVWLINQVGVLGVLFMLIFYFQLLRKAYVVYQEVSDPYWRPITLGLLGACFVFIIDFLTYSPTTMTFGSLTPVFYYIAAVCFKAKTLQDNAFNNGKIRRNIRTW